MKDFRFFVETVQQKRKYPKTPLLEGVKKLFAFQSLQYDSSQL